MFAGLEMERSVAKPGSGGSKRSNLSSQNAEHNATANFNVAPSVEGNSGYAMNGSSHSFYGTQVAA